MTGPLRFVVEPDEAGARLDVLVADRAGLSRSAASRWLDAVDPTVDGSPARRSTVPDAGATVDVPAQAAPTVATAPPVPPVVHRDEHLLVLDKPAGLVVHPGAGHLGDTLVDALLAAGTPLCTGTAPERPGIVHRLDRDTSGLLVVASTDVARDGLIQQLRERTVRRRYLAVARGTLAATEGTVDAPIGRHPGDRQRFACVEDGREARTHWTVLDTAVTEAGRVSLVECRLETGRTHQIRVHLEAIGNPVLGDPRYGNTERVDRALEVPRLALHAAELGLVHPVTGEELLWRSPLPPDLAGVVARAGLTAAA